MAARRRGGAQYIPRPEQWRAGGPPPWPETLAPAVADVVRALHTRPGLDVYVAEPGARLSAVLALLVDGPQGAEVLLTRRSAHLRNHRGEISFPGGRVDPGEHVEQAALREAGEEVGLDAEGVTIVGHLDPMMTFVSQSYIVPVVATAESHPALEASPAEVDRILWLPLAELTRTDTFHEEWWDLFGEPRQILFFELDDETIWGATGRMLYQLLSLVADT